MPENLIVKKEEEEEEKEEVEDKVRVRLMVNKGREKYKKESEAKATSKLVYPLQLNNLRITFFLEVFLFCDGTVPGILLV